MVHIIKVYFTGPKQDVQIRRLAVNSDVVSKFDLLHRKIREMFPGFAQNHIEVTWKDSENDVIHMSTDEELAQALANASDDILRIYAYSTNNQIPDENKNVNFESSHNVVHQNVICDGCDKVVHGYRYKCLQCPNFDLCSACNAVNKHENHDMIKLVKPTHISREWVFPGARKIWRSMFGRCPYSYFTASTSANENEKAGGKGDAKKNEWPGILEDLLKGGFVSADKVIKDNLGNFVNFLESVSGNLDVKIERDPPKPNRCSEKQCNKTDQKKNEGFSNAASTSAATPCKSAEPVNDSSIPMMPKTADQLSPSAPSDGDEKDQRKKTAEPCDLLSNPDTKFFEDIEKTKSALIDVASMFLKPLEGESKSACASGDSEQKQANEATKPCGLFGDNESADGWTILNHLQEAEKIEEAKSANETGAKPKYPNIYPSIFEKTESSDVPPPNAETKPKEVVSKQSDDAQVPTKCDNGNDKLDQNDNAPTCNDPEIMNALMKMQAMGFTNEGGWLERLLITKHGNINSALDALYPNTRRN